MTERQKKILLISGIVFALLILLAFMLKDTIKELIFVVVTFTIEWIVSLCKVLGWAI